MMLTTGQKRSSERQLRGEISEGHLQRTLQQGWSSDPFGILLICAKSKESYSIFD